MMLTLRHVVALISAWVLEGAQFVCFRLLKGRKPKRSDFESHKARGLWFDPANERYADGVSVWATVDQARAVTQHRKPVRAEAIAELSIPTDVFRVERWGAPGHSTVWGSPDELLARVISVVPV